MVLLGVLVLFFPVVVVAMQLPTVGASLALGMFVLTSAQRAPIVPDVFTTGGFSVSIQDVVVVILLASALLRICRGHLPRALNVPALGLIALVSLHVLRGVTQYGLQASINSSRTWIAFAVALVYAATIDWTERFGRVVVASGVALVVTTAVGFAQTGLHDVKATTHIGNTVVDARPLSAAGALLLLQATLVLMTRRWHRPAARLMLGAVFVVTLVVLQHRSVWVAGLAAATVAFVGWSGRTLRTRPHHVHAATGLALLASPAILLALLGSRTLGASVAEVGTPHSTIMWRFESWRALLHEHRTIGEYVFGSPAATSWERTIFGATTQVTPHNLYIEALFRFGLLGLVVLAALWLVAVRSRRMMGAIGIPSEMVIALVLTQLIFSVAYPLALPQGLILGVIVSRFARAPRTVPSPVHARPGQALAPASVR
jgi:hypothetical protein